MIAKLERLKPLTTLYKGQTRLQENSSVERVLHPQHKNHCMWEVVGTKWMKVTSRQGKEMGVSAVAPVDN